MHRCVVLPLAAIVGLGVGCSAGLPDEPVPVPEMPPVGSPVKLPDDPRRQFDFWLGEWNVRNLKLDGADWKHAGDAVARIRPVAAGGAVLEEWNGELGGEPLIGFSLRAYDPRIEQWVIWLNWHSGNPGGFAEMHGSRNGERIEQFPPSVRDKIRYGFSRAHTESCQWDEAQSKDGGETWITTWVMQFSRLGPPEPLDASNAAIVEPPEWTRNFPQTRILDHLLGSWSGTSAGEREIRARVTSMIEGLGLLQFLDIDGESGSERTLTALGWDRTVKGWVALRVDDGPQGIRRMLLTPESDTRELTFTTTEAPWLRESWLCPTDDACTWKRETSEDGATWLPATEAQLSAAE